MTSHTAFGLTLVTVLMTAWAGITWADPLVGASKISIEAEYLRYKLAHARSLKCTFSTVMQADWKGGRLATTRRENETFSLHFDSIDTTKKRARLIGNLGADDVAVLATTDSLSFIEITPSGNTNFTTVFPAYKAGGQEFIAVTSRHLLFPGLADEYPFPSQSHGSCQVWE